jgi:hypothetical protein
MLGHLSIRETVEPTSHAQHFVLSLQRKQGGRRNPIRLEIAWTKKTVVLHKLKKVLQALHGLE